MSLDTVLKIGEAFRQSNDSLKYFKYIEPLPTDNKGNIPLCVTIPVKEDFSFDWNGIKITPENEIDKLYYLKFKTSDSDNNPIKYLFGDIYFGLSKGEDRGGWYKISRKKNKKGEVTNHSFYEGKKFIKELEESEVLNDFRKNFEESIVLFDNVLKYHIGLKLLINSDYNVFDLLQDEGKMLEFSAQQIFYDILAKKSFKKDLQKLFKRDIEKWEDVNKDEYAILMKSYSGNIFLHFEFPREKSWLDYNLIVESILSLIYNKFVSKTAGGTGNQYVFNSYLYKNLCSGDIKNDVQFPGFKSSAKHKSKSFNEDDVQNLFYALSYTNKGKMIQGTDIKLIVLPRGENLIAKDYEDFQEKQNEVQVVANNVSFNSSLFDFVKTEKQEITSFDLIFTKKGGTTSPDKDLLEISGIEKSKLRQTKERISQIANDVFQKRKTFIKTDKDLKPPLSPENSFKNILGNPLVDNNGKVKFDVNPKYQSHLLKVLPQIYSDSYFKDDMLLNGFIQNVEYSIRSGDSKYSILKFDLMFLLKIQNNKNDKYMEITESKSYQLGLKIGKLSKPLKNEIKSFEKTYVGLLSRRIATKDDCVSFSNDICEKLTMHEKVWKTMAAEVCSELVAIPNNEYDKEKFAIGFFEGYFKYEASDKKKDFFNRLEKTLADYEDNTELSNETKQLADFISELNNN